MQLSDLMMKLADGRRLNNTEKDTMRNELRAMEEAAGLVKQWSQPGSANPYFQDMAARSGNFGIAPIEGMHVARTGAQSIPNNTETNVELNGRTPNTNLLSNTSIASRLKITQSHEVLAVLGTVEWANNATGRRGIHINTYNESDAFITGYTLHSLAPSGVAVDTLPFMGGLYFLNNSTAYYIRLTVIQTSGGALDMNGCRAYFFALR